MRISDWSSDVCSSDLPRLATLQRIAEAFDTSMHALLGAADPTPAVSVVRAGEGVRLLHDGDPEHGVARALVHQGRDIEAIEVSGAPPDFAEPSSPPGAALPSVVSGEV